MISARPTYKVLMADSTGFIIHALSLSAGTTVGTNGATSTEQVRIAVLGASGYTGEEVVRLLALHPNFSVAALTGESQAGKASA